MPVRRAVVRFVGGAGVAIVACLALAGQAVAVPPPPPNPSDGEIRDSRSAADAKAGEVGRLTGQLAQAQSKLDGLADEVEAKQENAMRALVDLEAAEDAATAAAHAADGAKAEAAVAENEIETARRGLDDFAAGSFVQGSTIGSMSAYLGAKSPRDLLDRATLLDAVAGSQLDVLDKLKVAQTLKANKDSAARKALQDAQQRKDAAAAARRTAEDARAAAVLAQQSQEHRANELRAEESRLEQELAAAQSRLGNLQGQREQYQRWLAAKQAEDAENARRAAAAAARPSGGRPVAVPAVAAGGTVKQVIQRALSQLGVPYAWGGGNASGPTRGIRDGGVADLFGDYRKVGFDCSGLMIYAFAAAGISLPHYSGYQYLAGRRVPAGLMQPGDMLFWGGAFGIHHVALYLGNGQMVEAPQSGSAVRISPVRYNGLMPFATRLL